MISHPPAFCEFKPPGVPRRHLQTVTLTLGEYEALRLADYAGRDHAAGAREMEISRPTFTRLLQKARQKMAAMMVEGKALVIEGGAVHFRGNLFRCQDCRRVFRAGMEEDLQACPECGSARLINLAEQFGHGWCCPGGRRRGGR
jgi:predicted DNA-binding protein (UPF0251 family)